MQGVVGRISTCRLASLLRRCEDLYDRAPVGYLVVGDDGLLLSTNLVAGELMGRDGVALRGRSVSDLVASHDRERFEAFWEQVTGGGADISCEVDFRHASGEFVTLACHVRQLARRQCWIVGLIDVTDLHEARRIAEHRLELEHRADIAQHLYDSIRQRLFGVTFMIDAAVLSPTTSEPMRTALDRVRSELGAIITDIREIIFDEVEGLNGHTKRRDAPPNGDDPPAADPTRRSE